MRTSRYKKTADIPKMEYEIGFHGALIDERSTAGVSFLKNRTISPIELKYDASNFILEIGGKPFSEAAYQSYFASLKGKTVILEATSLGFPEIFLVLSNSIGAQISILYCEPMSYRMNSYGFDSPSPDYSLTTSFAGFFPIPDRFIDFGSETVKRGVLFLGFESSRIERLFEDFEIDPNRMEVVVGLPPFQPGWELSTYSANIDVLMNRGVNNSLHYCTANNPKQVVERLIQIKAGLATNETLFVAPFGTKPHGVGAAIFCAQNPDVAIVFDHPIRSQGRTENISAFHLFELDPSGLH